MPLTFYTEHGVKRPAKYEDTTGYYCVFMPHNVTLQPTEEAVIDLGLYVVESGDLVCHWFQTQEASNLGLRLVAETRGNQKQMSISCCCCQH